jgi:hypothetical protein
MAKCTASFKARQATDAENAVPLRIPRCSLEASGIGEMLCASRACREETIWRPEKAAGPSKTLMEGFPIRVPAI